MHQRVRLLVSATLPSLLFGVWATFLVLTGAAPVVPAGGSVALTHTTAPASAPASVRFDGPQRAVQPRSEERRTTAGQQITATDHTARPPGAPPALPGPVASAYRSPVLGVVAAQPRQERAPPRTPYDPRHTRAPPSTSHS